MQISKFPVVGRYGEYQVRISENDWSNDYIVEILVSEKLFWIFNKFTRVTERSGDKNEWRGHFVTLAKNAIDSYENWLDQYYKNQEIEQKGISEWENWDGK